MTPIAHSELPARARAYRERAVRAAFGVVAGRTLDEALDPERGTAACLGPMVRVYEYYGRLYLEHPGRLLWAGLARLAGAPIVQGLANATAHGIDNAYCRVLVGTCRQIFDDVAWLHEAFLDDPAIAVELAGAAGRGTAWADIAAGGESTVADANLRLLEHEQLVVAQPGYDAVRDDARAISRSVRAVHPYHDDFPGDDIGDPVQRWAWVRSMWQGWVRLPARERARLVRLPFEQLRARRFG